MSEELKLIAARIQDARESSEVSLEAAAAHLGISVEAYQAYEKGGLDIPISTLYNLAGLFHVDLTELLTGSTPRMTTHSLVRNGHGIEVSRYPGYRFQSLAYKFVGRKAEPLLVTLEPGDKGSKAGLVTHDGQEFNYCLEGEVVVTLGEKEYLLKPGDSLYFDPMLPHGQRANGDATARFLTVILHDK